MTELKPARAELLAFAAAARDPDWARQLDGALTAAATAGWDWHRAGREACRLIFGGDSAHPRQIIDAVRNPLEPPKPADPAVAARALAEIRATVSAKAPARRRQDPGEQALEQVAKSRYERAGIDGLTS